MKESLRTRWLRFRLNLIPAYFATGARVTSLAADLREVRVALPLNWRTRNYVGTIFGGSMFAAVDPIYMVMLIRNLGPADVVWDKAATIRFERPGRDTLYATLHLTDDELAAIRDELATRPATERVYAVDLYDSAGVRHATVEQTIHIRRRTPGR